MIAISCSAGAWIGISLGILGLALAIGAILGAGRRFDQASRDLERARRLHRNGNGHRL